MRTRGLTLLPLFSVLLLGCAHLPRGNVSARPEHQTLIMMLDGVPFDLIDEMKKEGYFTSYQAPSKVISTFPSTTSSALGGMFRSLGIRRSPGYDRKFLSYQTGKVEGLIIDPKDTRLPPFWKEFDYGRKTIWQKSMIYLFPGVASRRDLERIRTMVFSLPDREHYVTYIGGTDGFAHVLGRRRLKRFLIFMDRQLDRLRQDYQKAFGRELQIALFSDHGFHFVKPQGVSLSSLALRLRRAGLNLASDINRPHHVVSIEWGNISGANFHVHEPYVSTVARILAGLEGVDIVAFRTGPEVFVLAGEGEARIVRQQNSWGYRPVRGDPLRYADVLDSLRSRGRLNSRGLAADKDWFEATKDHQYPDALFRIYDALFSLVDNPAPILMSTKEDYEYGDFRTRLGSWLRGRLKGTHGGLFQNASAAFAMTTDPAVHLPQTLRYTELLPSLLGPRRGRSHRRTILGKTFQLGAAN